MLDLIGLGPLTLLAAKALTGSEDTISLFRSVDGGATWQPFQNGFGGSGSRAVRLGVYSPLAGAPATIFATSGRIEEVDRRGIDLARRSTGRRHQRDRTVACANPALLWAGGESAVFWPPSSSRATRGKPGSRSTSRRAGTTPSTRLPGTSPTRAWSISAWRKGHERRGCRGELVDPDLSGSSMYTFGLAIRPLPPLKIYAAGASFTLPQGVVFHESLTGGLSRSFTCIPPARQRRLPSSAAARCG